MIGAVNWWAFAIAVGTATIVIAVRRLLPRAPAFVVVVGHVDAGLPAPTLPSTSIGDVYHLLGAAVSVALLVLSSSMLTGSVLANRDHEKVSAPREFLGLAAACAGVGVLVSLLEVLRRPILPPTAVLGRLSGSPTWRNVDDYDGAKLLPGLLVSQFEWSTTASLP